MEDWLKCQISSLVKYRPKNNKCQMFLIAELYNNDQNKCFCMLWSGEGIRTLNDNDWLFNTGELNTPE